uniref:Uncharacterized protein n=1 Tax=Salix viminalis TaxID=40686 RepID=A0A6N2MH34_SALVM
MAMFIDTPTTCDVNGYISDYVHITLYMNMPTAIPKATLMTMSVMAPSTTLHDHAHDKALRKGSDAISQNTKQAQMHSKSSADQTLVSSQLGIAPAGNRTRVCTVAGYYSTTRPLVLVEIR